MTITSSAAQCVNVIANTADPLNNPTRLHLTLADGSTNSLNTTAANFSGIHVTYGAQLTIDDAVRNWGEVEGGRIVGETDEKGTPKP